MIDIEKLEKQQELLAYLRDEIYKEIGMGDFARKVQYKRYRAGARHGYTITLGHNEADALDAAVNCMACVIDKLVNMK